MFRRSTLMAAAMLGLGTLLGYAAAWGNLSLPAWGSTGEPVAAAPEKKEIETPPDRKTVFTGFQGGADIPKAGNPRLHNRAD